MTRGGGTLIAVHRKFRAELRELHPFVDLLDADVTWIDVPISQGPTGKKIRLLNCYFPHSKFQIESQSSLFEFLSNIYTDCPNDYFIVLGDFNIPGASWIPNDPNQKKFKLEIPNYDILTSQLSAFMCFTDWYQFNNIPNQNDRQLDLVLSNIDCSVSNVEALVPIDYHHPVFCVKTCIGSTDNYLKPAGRIVRRFFAADYDIVNAELDKVDWELCLPQDSIENAVDTFYDILNRIIDDLIPTKIINSSHDKFPVWYSRPLIKMIKNKTKTHKKWKIYGRIADYIAFSKLRAKIKSMESSCYKLFISRTENNIRYNSKSFWSFLKSKTNINGIPNTVFLGNSVGNSGKEVADLFNTYFQSVFVKNATSQPPFQSTPLLNDTAFSNCLVNNVNITTCLVESYLRELVTSKGCGPDGIHPIFLKNCRARLAFPICLLFNLSLRTGTLPCCWKRSIVVPIYKSGNKHDIKNYRGISKLSVIPKLFEKIIYDTLFYAVRPQLVNQQHGFINRRSTESNLCQLIDYAMNAMDKGYQVDVIYTDYSKAFDKISHSLLIHKLQTFGIHGNLLRWLTSYLRDRTQAVAIKGYTSSFVPVSSGVPQGSHLGPLLFNIYINDVVDCFKFSDLLLYADDTKIYTIIKSSDDCMKLQADLDRLSCYCSMNELYLNVEKCCAITFTRKRNKIEYNYSLNNKNLRIVSEVKDLGLNLDSELQFISHIDKISAKAYRMLGFIFRQSRDFTNPKTLQLLFNAFVRSNLEYATTVWNPHFNVHINTIEKIQNKFIRTMKYKFKSFCPDNFSLQTRREIRDQIFLFKIIHGLIDSPNLLSKISIRCPDRRTRSTSLFAINFGRTTYARNKFLARACRTYNEKFSDIDIFHLSLQQFVSAIKCTANNNIV